MGLQKPSRFISSFQIFFESHTALPYNLLMYTIIETPTFSKLASDYWTEDERGNSRLLLLRIPKAVT
jgi:hypothetical protein